MPIYKDPKSGNWYISIYDENGKRIRQSTGTSKKSEAQVIHDEVARNIRLARFGLARPVEPDIPHVPISTFSAKYDEYMRAQFEGKTAEACRSAFGSLKRFYQARNADPFLTDVTPGQIAEWQVWVLSTSKPATLDIHFRTLRAAWNRAIRWGDAVENPFTAAEKPRLDTDEDNENVRFFEPEELQKLYAVTQNDERWHSMIKFYLYSGMRRQELTHLEWSEIDTGAMEIRIAGAKTVHLPKIRYTQGRRSYTLPAQEYRFRTKNGKRRTIPINTRFLALIEDLVRQRKEYPGLSRCPLVFPAMRTACQNRVQNADKVTARFRESVKAAGLPGSLTLHSLRHTFASRLVQRGKSLYQVGELLGHSDLEVTKVYAHLTPKSLAPVVADLDFE